VNVRGEFSVKAGRAIQDMRAAMLLLRGNSLAKNLRPLRVQNNAFNFGAAEVDADAMVAMHF